MSGLDCHTDSGLAIKKMKNLEIEYKFEKRDFLYFEGVVSLWSDRRSQRIFPWRSHHSVAGRGGKELSG